MSALARLGITGPQLYLLDVIPLVDMLWADGRAQTVEVELLEDFVRQHVAAINELAGTPVLTPAEGLAFLRRFLRERPDPRLLELLRALVRPVRLATSDPRLNDRQRTAILAWCLDIGAACVSEYPYGVRERFSQQEKERFIAILNALTGPR